MKKVLVFLVLVLFVLVSCVSTKNTCMTYNDTKSHKGVSIKSECMTYNDTYNNTKSHIRNARHKSVWTYNLNPHKNFKSKSTCLVYKKTPHRRFRSESDCAVYR